MALFTKKDKEEPTPVPDFKTTEPERHIMNEYQPAQAGIGTPSTVGSAVSIKGELLGDEDLTVEGHVEGIIDIKKNLIVGAKGLVEAEVHALSVTIHGRLVGNIIADRRVEILSSGSLEGNIRSPKVVIAEGAHFKGNVDMNPVDDRPAFVDSSVAADKPKTGALLKKP